MTDGQRFALIAGLLMFIFKTVVIFFWWRKKTMSKTLHAKDAPWPSNKPKAKRAYKRRDPKPRKTHEVDKRFEAWASRSGVDIDSLALMDGYKRRSET